MTPLNRLFPLIALLAACGDSDVKDSGWPMQAPDVTGNYNVLITGATGCDSNYTYVTDWAQGFMGISGEDPSNLTYAFRDEISFEGWVDESWTYQFGGLITWGTAEESVAHTGIFFMEDEIMKASGEFSVEVRDSSIESEQCTLTARLEATRIAD